MIRIETINQFDGWGNDTPKLPTEHFYSKGFSRSGAGSVVGKYIYNQFTQANYSGISGISKLVKGLGRDYPSDVVGSYLFAGDGGNNHIYQSDQGIGSFENVYRVLGQNWFGAGMIVDQKTRLLYSGWRYLGMFDSSVANYSAGTVTVTNGSTTVTGSGTTFVVGDVGKIFRISGENSAVSFIKISAYVSATEVTLSAVYQGTTGSGKSYFIYRAWTDQWKDFGTEISSVASPMETYEDTVLIGRNNNIVSLNTTTDTVTTDASPAFTMPTGYVCYAISANANGIMLAYNFQGRGVLVLWDNFSDRSIAPWIRLNDSIIGVVKYLSGWIVMTTKALYYTNGYSIELLTDEFLFTSVSTLGTASPDGLLVRGDYLFFGANSTFNKRRGGLYRMNLKTKLVEFYGGVNSSAYDAGSGVLFYSPDFARLYVANGSALGYLAEGAIDSTKTNSFITNEVGIGENWKVAEAIRIPISVSNLISSRYTYTFTISAKINNLDRQLYNYSQVKSNGSTTTMVVDETTNPIAEAGDEIEFLTGNNKGVICNISSIDGGGTATATYTLDTTLANATATNENFNLSGFKKVGTQTVTAGSSLPDIYFDIKNRYKGKKFMIKLVVTGATIPIEIKPFQFIFDDLGEIQ